MVNGFGPSAITVNLVYFPRTTRIRVANLTIVGGWGSSAVVGRLAMDRANLITRLEVLENATYGFQTQGSNSNVLIPWPTLELTETNQTISYETDVIRYNFSCGWYEPGRVGDSNTFWNVSGLPWVLY